MFIAVDLKVVEGLAAAVGRAGAMSEDAVLAGLVRLWHRCWADEADVLTSDEIAGIFAFDVSKPDGSARAIGALVAFGFLETKGANWRIRGASRYLRLKESRRRGGKKAKNNLKRGNSPGSRAGAEPGASRDTPPAPPGSYTESPSHRTPNTEEKISAPRKKRADAAKPPDPRHTPLVAKLDETFKAKRGIAYPFDGRAAKTVRRLLQRRPSHEDALWPVELVGAWGRALEATFPDCSSLEDFERDLPRFLGTGPPSRSSTGPPKGASWTQNTPDDGKGFLEGLES